MMDSVSTLLVLIKWYPKEDYIQLDIGDLNFAGRLRGRKVIDESSTKIHDMLTRRHCVSKVAGVFDLTGKTVPFISLMKLDLQNMGRLNIGWDVVPDNLRNIWLDKFQRIQEMKILKYRRAIVPEDAESLMMDTVDFGDASKYWHAPLSMLDSR